MARSSHVIAGHVKLLHLDICILPKLDGSVYLRQHVLNAVFLGNVQRQEADLREAVPTINERPRPACGRSSPVKLHPCSRMTHHAVLVHQASHLLRQPLKARRHAVGQQA